MRPNLVCILLLGSLTCCFCEGRFRKIGSPPIRILNPKNALEDPLFLTPYINSDQISLAQELSRVEGIEPSLESYSGFITVNETYNTNIFFWFFPAANNASTAPVTLWCEGGPGASGLFSLFNENGPYTVVEDITLRMREQSWHLETSMIFFDNPVGTGFSFTESEAGYLTSGTDGSHMHSFLIQFFTMFPEYRENDFYAAGVSFGGIFAPTIAHKIHTVNQEADGFKINLEGLLVESGWSDSIRQVDYGSFLYHVGLLDEEDRDFVSRETEVLKTYIAEERYDEAHTLWKRTLVDADSFVFNRTGLSPEVLYNYLSQSGSGDRYNFYVTFVEQEFVRNAIHVGSLPFYPSNYDFVVERYLDKVHGSVKSYLEELLDAKENYRVVYYSGQLDVITYHLGIKHMLQSLEWEGADMFKNAKPGTWKVENKVAGFSTAASRLTYVLMRGAGHDANADQPEWGFDVMSRFIRNASFTT